MKNNLIYAALTTANGEHKQGVYTLSEYFNLTFNPLTVVLCIHGLSAKTKEEARGFVRDVLYWDAFCADNGGELMSWEEWSIIGDAFSRLARRFGLVREFRENGVI